MKSFFFKKGYLIALLCITSLLTTVRAQVPFPIKMAANGQDVHIESMTLSQSDSDPSIYVTGRIGNYSSTSYAPACGEDVTILTPYCMSTMDYKFFVARLYPNISGGSDIKWMVIGTTNAGFNPDAFSGKDIEVDEGGNVYVTGTLIGDVKFEQIYPAVCAYSIGTCGGPTNMRHALLKIDANGVPQWVAETDAPAAIVSYGEGLTLDEENGRLFTTGYLSTNYLSGSVSFQNATCSDQCGFSFAQVWPESPYVGFVAEYTLDGVNKRAKDIGEKVMDITMDADHEYQWITGSIKNADSDVLLARLHMEPLGVADYCVNFDIDIKPTSGVGGDIGLDLDYSPDGKVVLVGAYSQDCMFGAYPPLSNTAPGESDLFVAVYKEMLGMFVRAKSTSDLPWAPGSSVRPTYYGKRTICVDVKADINKFIIGYDFDGATLITRELNTGFFPFGISGISLVSTAGTARAMETEYSLFNALDDRYLTGDYLGTFNFGPCTMTASIQEGYVTRMNPSQVIYLTDNVDNETVQTAKEKTVYPNPSQGTVNVKYTLDVEALAVSLRIYDFSGQLVSQTKVSGYKGENETHLALDLPSGTYFLQVKADGAAVLSEKLVLVK